jgi:hypothetical protein
MKLPILEQQANTPSLLMEEGWDRDGSPPCNSLPPVEGELAFLASDFISDLFKTQ